MERLALPYDVADPITEVNLSVRRALALLRRTGKRLTPRIAKGSVNDGPEDTIPPSIEKSVVCEVQIDSDNPKDSNHSVGNSSCLNTRANTGARDESEGAHGHCTCKTRTLAVPFCMDTSLDSFQSFVDLLRDMLSALDSIVEITNDKRIGRAKTNEKCVEWHRNEPNDLQSKVGQGYFPNQSKAPEADELEKQGFIDESSAHGHDSERTFRNAHSASFTNAMLEVLRRSLKLLKINLFQLVRATAIRRAYRFGSPLVHTKATSMPGPTTAVLRKDNAEARGAPPGSSGHAPLVATDCSGNVDARASNKRPESRLRSTSPEAFAPFGVRNDENAEDSDGALNDEEYPKNLKTKLKEQEQVVGRSDVASSNAERAQGFVREIHNILWKLLETDAKYFPQEAEREIEQVHVRNSRSSHPCHFARFVYRSLLTSSFTPILRREAIGCSAPRVTGLLDSIWMSMRANSGSCIGSCSFELWTPAFIPPLSLTACPLPVVDK